MNSDAGLQVLPIGMGAHYSRYVRELERVKDLWPKLDSVETYGWHGNRADYAQAIAKNGFDISKVQSEYYYNVLAHYENMYWIDYLNKLIRCT